MFCGMYVQESINKYNICQVHITKAVYFTAGPHKQLYSVSVTSRINFKDMKILVNEKKYYVQEQYLFARVLTHSNHQKVTNIHIRQYSFMIVTTADDVCL